MPLPNETVLAAPRPFVLGRLSNGTGLHAAVVIVPVLGGNGKACAASNTCFTESHCNCLSTSAQRASLSGEHSV